MPRGWRCRSGRARRARYLQRPQLATRHSGVVEVGVQTRGRMSLGIWLSPLFAAGTRGLQTRGHQGFDGNLDSRSDYWGSIDVWGRPPTWSGRLAVHTISVTGRACAS